MADFALIAVAFLVVSVLVTFLIKKFTKNDTYFVISLIKTKKPIALFDKAAKNKKLLDFFALAGLVIGFGAIAIDFWFGRKLSKAKRTALFLASFLSLSLFMVALDYFFGGALSSNIFVGPFYLPLVISFGLMGLSGFTLMLLVAQAFDIVSKYLLGIRSCPAVAPLIPGVQLPNVPISPPLHAWISLLIILVVHEAMHGVLGRRHGFKIKSTGILLLGFLPIGAFVEPDEKQVKRAKDEKVLPFLAAGPMANIVVMLFSIVVVVGSMAAVVPLTNHFYPGLLDNAFTGVKISEVLEKTEFCGSVFPSSAFGKFEAGDTIKEVNGVAITGPRQLVEQLQKNRLAAKTFLLERNGQEIELTLQPNALGQFGFVPEPIRNESLQVPESYSAYATAVDLFVEFFFWLLFLNFSAAALNFLPMSPFDGGRMAKILFAPYISFTGKTKEQRQKLIGKFFLFLVLALFIINALPLFF